MVVAGKSKKMLDEFVAYCKPLVGDTMIQLPMENGRQRLARIKPIFAEQKLAKYVPQADRMKAPGK